MDGRREKESRAFLCLGRYFAKALAALFEHENTGASLSKNWGTSHESEPHTFFNPERASLIGLTCLMANGKSQIAPKLNRRRGACVFPSSDETSSWGWQQTANEIRAGQDWKVVEELAMPGEGWSIGSERHATCFSIARAKLCSCEPSSGRTVITLQSVPVRRKTISSN